MNVFDLLRMTPRQRVANFLKGWVANFLKGWVAMQWAAMHKTQHGLRLNRMGNTGRGKDRRADKLERPESKHARAYRRRYAS